MKLLLIRHGDPDYEIDSLTEKGHREAQLLAEKMQHVPVKAFYVSPLGRARATIDYTLKKTGREATILDWMEEFPATLNPQESIGLKNAYGTHKNTVNRVVWDMLPEYWEAFRIPEKKISIVTLNLSDARFLRRLDGKLYLGEGCDLYLEDGALRSVEAGEQKAFVWENGAFQPCSVQAEETGCEEAPRLTAETGDVSCRSNDSVCMLTKLSDSPFTLTGPGLEEVLLSGPGPLDWYRLTVPDPYGFVSLELPCDIMQLYTDGTLTADDFYLGVPCRLPKKLLFGKECYIVTTTTEQNIYRERPLYR